MFEEILTVALIAYLIFITISLYSYWKKYNNLSEKIDEKIDEKVNERFKLFCEDLEYKEESPLRDKKSNDSNIIEHKYSNTINK